MDHLSLSLFGHFQLSINQQELHGLTSEKGQVLLAYLVLENQKSHSRKKLSTLFWPNGSQKSAQNSLRQTLYRLKTAFIKGGPLDQFVSSNRQSIRFDESCSYWTDVNEFQQLITQRKIGNIEFDQKIQLYERVSYLYRGELLAGISIDDSAELDGWLTSRRTWFHNQGIETLYKLIESYARLGHLDLAQVYADKLLTLDPLNEKAFEQKLSILLQKGQSAEAHSAFDQFKSLLLHQIGIEPNPAIKALLHQQPPPQRIRATQPQRASQTVPNPIPKAKQAATKTFPLPAPPAHHTPFLQDGLSQPEPVQTFLDNPFGQTLLIHGLPGAGKTVLATEIAQQVAKERPVMYLDLKRIERETCQKVINQLHRPSVLLLDHLDRVPQISDLMAEIFAKFDQATVIGVSRLRTKLNRPNITALEHAGLQQPQATQLILSHANGNLTQETADHIASHLGGHPAAILELLRWNQIFPWEMIVQKIQFGDFLWDETPVADWFDTIWQSLSETEMHFAQRYAQADGQILADELGVMPLSFARSAMNFVEKGLISQVAGGSLQFRPIFCYWVQAHAKLAVEAPPKLEAMIQPAAGGPILNDPMQEQTQQIGTFE